MTSLMFLQYTKNNLEWQGQVFEEVTGKSDGKDVFAKVAENFGNKFINSFFVGHAGFFHPFQGAMFFQEVNGESTIKYIEVMFLG